MDHSLAERSGESLLGRDYPGVDWWAVSLLCQRAIRSIFHATNNLLTSRFVVVA
jgi:hypothetical protein